MKKLFTLTLAAALFAGVSTSAQAELELSGNVTSIIGYQHNDDKASGSNNAGAIDSTVTSTAPVADTNVFGVWVDQVEVDGDYTYGENVRVRFDLDFMDHGNNSVGNFATGLEQGYVTFNVPAGNGWEWAVGKFNAPVGLENVDRVDNTFVSYTPSWTYMVPKNVLGVKAYYEMNDTWNLDFSLINDFNGYSITTDSTSAAPSALLRVGGVWGEEDAPSSFNVALGAGYEHSTATGSNTTGNTAQNDSEGFDILANVWGEAVFNYFTLGYEGIARGTQGVVSTDFDFGFGGQLYGKYAASDTLSVQARYALHVDQDLKGDGSSATGAVWSDVYASGNGLAGMTHQGTLGLTHNITDGANVTAEYQFSYVDNDVNADASMYHAALVGFGYSF